MAELGAGRVNAGRWEVFVRAIFIICRRACRDSRRVVVEDERIVSSQQRHSEQKRSHGLNIPGVFIAELDFVSSCQSWPALYGEVLITGYCLGTMTLGAEYQREPLPLPLNRVGTIALCTS